MAHSYQASVSIRETDAPYETSSLRSFIRQNAFLLVGAFLLALLCLVAVLAPFISHADPAAIAPSRRLQPPSAEYWFGTDMFGRDVYSRVVYGARVSLTVGIGVALLASFFGLLIGLIAGYIRWSDHVVMRIMDGLMAIPPVLLAIALIALTRAGVGNVIIAITIAETPRVARLMRSLVLTLREQPFVEAAVMMGASNARIMLRHILPNALGPLLVQATYICASAMIIEAILSFIGAGTPTSVPSWGNIMSEGRALWQVKPYLVFFPAACLSLTVLAINLLGDGLRELFDPRQHSRRI